MLTSPFRLLAFDLDGTLLERDGTLAEASANFLQGLARAGVELVAATGRRLWSALPHLHRAHVGGSCVVHNGAMVADVARAEPLLVRPLVPEMVRQLVRRVEERGFAPLVFTSAPRGPGEVLARRDAADPSGYRAWYFRYAAGHVTLLDELAAAPFEGALRVVVHGEREALADLVAAAEAACGVSLRGFVQRETTVATWRAEFLLREASKWSGVAWVAKRLGIAAAEIVAVGDEANDVELLEAAGHSLAAPGASEAARVSAREALDGDGPRAVVRALERVFS